MILVSFSFIFLKFYLDIYFLFVEAKEEINISPKPTLIIHGDDDLVLPYENSVNLHKLLSSQPDSEVKLVILPRGGHMFWDTSTEDSVNEVNFFLAQHDGLLATL